MGAKAALIEEMRSRRKKTKAHQGRLSQPRVWKENPEDQDAVQQVHCLVAAGVCIVIVVTAVITAFSIYCIDYSVLK